MKTVKMKVALLHILLCGLAVPAFAQTPVTVPPATMPADAVPAMPASAAAPAPSPSAQMPGMPVPAAVPADMQLPASASTTVVTPVLQPAMPIVVPPAASAAIVTTPPPGMPNGTPAVVTQVMTNLQDSKSNVSVEDLSKAQDALTRLDLLLQIEKKIGEIKKTQDDRESNGSSGGGMMGQIPASALVLPGQMNGSGMQNAMPGGVQGGTMPIVSSPVIASAPIMSNSSYEIEQISGTNGNFSAILTTPDGDRKTVRAGDKLDGRKIESISLDSVQLSAAAGSKKGSKKGGKTLTIHNDGVLLTPMAR